MKKLVLLICFCLLSLDGTARSGEIYLSARGGVLVFAPHPDDEVLGCAGIIQQALEQGRPVHIALFTNGDGNTNAAAGLAGKPVDKLDPADYLDISRFRQQQTFDAMKLLGVGPESIMLLGYPDSGLDQVYLNRSNDPYRQKFLLKTATYGTVRPDYHSLVYGKAAPYTYASVLADTVEILRKLQPDRIYVTDEADSHRDHSAAFRFVRDAAVKAGFNGEIFTYLVHSRGHEWPWPWGVTPQRKFESHVVNGEVIPSGVAWPPPVRVPLTSAQAEAKLRSIRAHKVPMPDAASEKSHQDYMESFVKSEEIFWLRSVR